MIDLSFGLSSHKASYKMTVVMEAAGRRARLAYWLASPFSHLAMWVADERAIELTPLYLDEQLSAFIEPLRASLLAHDLHGLLSEKAAYLQNIYRVHAGTESPVFASRFSTADFLKLKREVQAWSCTLSY